MSDVGRTKRKLEALASRQDDAADWKQCADRALDAVGDLESAATFLDGDGLDDLERARTRAKRAGDERYVRQIDRASAAFEEFRRVAAGEDDREGTIDHFHSGHDTTLTRDGVVDDE